MASPDISHLSLQELKELRNKIDQQMVAVEANAHAEARKQVQEIASKLGISVQDLMAGAGGKSGKGPKVPKAAGPKVAAKYRNPEDGKEWTGRGRQPKWIEAAVAGGKKLEDFAIKA